MSQRWPDPNVFFEAPPAFEPSGYPPEVVVRAAKGWQRLYDDERDSALAATLFLEDLIRLNAPEELLAGATRLITDEVRHSLVCAEVITRMGVEPEKRELDRRRASGDSFQRVLVMGLQGFFVGESLSAASFAVGRKAATEPLARWAFTELLRDEARHGPFGARVAEWLLPNLSAEEKAALWPGIVVELTSMEERVGGPYDAEALAKEEKLANLEQFEALGLIRGSRTCQAFHNAIRRSILPRLTRLGVVQHA